MADQPIPSPLPQQQPLQEKKELFRREEVRTMKKDIAKLQEEEALQERERISQLKTDDEMKKERERIERLKKEEEEKMFSRVETLEKARSEIKTAEAKEINVQAQADAKAVAEKAAAETPPKPTYRLPFSLPRKPTIIDKFFSRAVVLGIMIALWGMIFTFWYWYFIAKPKEQPTPPAQQTATSTLPIVPPIEPAPTETTTPPIEPTPTETSTLPIAPTLSPASFRVDAENIIEFYSQDELTNLLSQATQQYGGEDRFTRLALKDLQQNSYLTTQEFFQAFQINAPEGLDEKLSPDITLFVYTSLIANRLGFITQIIDPTFEMRSWEPTLEQDTQTLFVLLGKKDPSRDSAFRQTKYKTITFRYISFPSINFGLVWSVVNLKNQETGETQPFFIFTSSGESMMRIIDRLGDQIAVQ